MHTAHIYARRAHISAYALIKRPLPLADLNYVPGLLELFDIFEKLPLVEVLSHRVVSAPLKLPECPNVTEAPEVLLKVPFELDCVQMKAIGQLGGAIYVQLLRYVSIFHSL